MKQTTTSEQNVPELLKDEETERPSTAPESPEPKLQKKESSVTKFFRPATLRNYLKKQTSDPLLPVPHHDPFQWLKLNNKKKIEPMSSSQIPRLVEDCISYLEKNALQQVGITRVSGSSVQIKLLKKFYDKGKPVQLENVSDPHTVAGLLKLYLREQEDCLLTNKMYSEWIATADLSDENRVQQLKVLVDRLPQTYRAILERLLEFLVKIDQHSDVNRMDASNLATMFGPNLLKPENDTPERLLKDQGSVHRVMVTLIKEYNAVFNKQPISSPSTVKNTELTESAYLPPSPETERKHRKRRNTVTSHSKDSLQGDKRSYTPSSRRDNNNERPLTLRPNASSKRDNNNEKASTLRPNASSRRATRDEIEIRRTRDESDIRRSSSGDIHRSASRHKSLRPSSSSRHRDLNTSLPDARRKSLRLESSGLKEELLTADDIVDLQDLLVDIDITPPIRRSKSEKKPSSHQQRTPIAPVPRLQLDSVAEDNAESNESYFDERIPTARGELVELP